MCDDVCVVRDDPAVLVHGDVLEFASNSSNAQQPAEVGVGDGFDWLTLVLTKRNDEFACAPALLDQMGLLS